ncbi:hypothetical protein [Cohnella silvisoli]|uniref:Uncharacterized protein n=1 Tax=Cohnella silvisoli TaxID=2873699 RepID=A0ABV1L491_9BACL|nr:hypothetical protein [Cohnella silvisoli]MCD9025846.1 hypothetical protein [Cohnella silvisoli]
MIPKTVIPEKEYENAFRQYVLGLAGKWLGLDTDLSQTSLVLQKIEEVSKENYRANYLNYLLPLVDSKYSEVVSSGTIVSMHKVLYSLRMNDLAYNDFMLNRFCDILLKDVDRKGLFATPLPEDYKDLQKLLWNFVQTFRKKAATEYFQHEEVI